MFPDTYYAERTYLMSTTAANILSSRMDLDISEAF
jgi:hypothetical protein